MAIFEHNVETCFFILLRVKIIILNFTYRLLAVRIDKMFTLKNHTFLHYHFIAPLINNIYSKPPLWSVLIEMLLPLKMICFFCAVVLRFSFIKISFFPLNGQINRIVSKKIKQGHNYYPKFSISHFFQNFQHFFTWWTIGRNLSMLRVKQIVVQSLCVAKN